MRLVPVDAPVSEHKTETCARECRYEKDDHRERDPRPLKPGRARHRRAGKHPCNAAEVKHRGIAGEVYAAPTEQDPASRASAENRTARRGHARLPTSTTVPVTMAASARLNVGHAPSAMKSTTAPRSSRSTRLPAAPPRVKPRPTAPPI